MKKDLIILAADPSAKIMLTEVLIRLPQIFGLRAFSSEIKVHQQRDPACYKRGTDFLATYANSHTHCILIFDHEGSGAEKKSVQEIESELEGKLTRGLWPNRNAVIVIEPELENWVWTNSPHTSNALGWGNEPEALKTWLVAQNFLLADETKPLRPKEAMQAAMKLRRPISSEIFETIGKKASFKSCTSPSFLKFKSTITSWFSQEKP